MLQKKVIASLRESGPLSGDQLFRRTGADVFELWRTCRVSPAVLTRRAGFRFLRLDRAVEGYARLSPSIRREFQTYVVVGIPGQEDEMESRVEDLSREIKKISRRKFRLAGRTVGSLLEKLPPGKLLREKACFILAGDVVYQMAHGVERPEKSTGKPVRGSDLDLVVIFEDDLSEETVHTLDEAIHDRKYYLLAHPEYREEIDYIIKPMSRFRKQLKFDTFEAMVAGKILWEGVLIGGSERIFHRVKSLLESSLIPEKLSKLEERARKHRKKAEDHLEKLEAITSDCEFSNLFYTRQERLEEIDGV